MQNEMVVQGFELNLVPEEAIAPQGLIALFKSLVTDAPRQVVSHIHAITKIELDAV